MHLTTAIATTFASLSLAQSGYTITSNGTITCDMPNAAYCTGTGSNIIIRCDANRVGQAGNCNDNLAGEPGDDSSATCWSSCGALSGLAACAKNGTVYPDSGTPFASNATGVCPVVNGTNPGGPVMNATTPLMSNGTAPNGTSPHCNCTEGGEPTSSPAAASNTPPVVPSPSASASSVPYQGAGSTTSVSMMGAGAVVGFVAFSAALALI
ncbi:hypothetical protein EJ03DRAFT_381058 [Teratosphaeria nubilosa]|uniref:Uncharacterized protein n=1 Tax=Teratosphaeria nubilosa TaxID=161662 RepID=A0A6G1LGC5_9PEZI|nr:hypothetical protein EJ03DRAFT_381058 [Teratosphaeria nubilosa]